MPERTEPSDATSLAVIAMAMATTSIFLWGGSALSPGLGVRFHLTATGIGVVLGALSLGAALAMIPAGAIVDRRGTRVALALGVPLAALSLAGAALSSTSGIRSFPALLACFALHGAACTLISQSTAVAALASVPFARRGLALGVRQSSISAGGLVAAGLLPLLYAHGGVPLALGVCSGLIAVIGCLAIHSTPDTRPASSPIPLRLVLGDHRLHLVLAVALCMVVPLTAVLSLAIPAAAGDSWSTGARVVLFGIVSAGAVSARVAFGLLADRGSGSWRLRTLRVIALLTLAASILEWAVWRRGEAAGILAMIPLAIGALGSNGVLYLVAAELLGHAAAGRATAAIGVALFGGGAFWAPILGRVVDGAGPEALWLVAAGGAAAALACTRPLGAALARAH